MRAMILAAGRGERLRPLTDFIPKPMVKVKNKPLLEYHIENLKKNGIYEIVINHAWLGEKIVDYFKDGKDFGVNITYSVENEGGLETAGGIINALPLLGEEPFLVLNGDTFLDSLPQIPEKLEKEAHLWLVENPKHNLKGDFGIEGDYLNNMQTFTFSGLGIYHPKFFDNLSKGKLALAPIIREKIGSKLITASIYTGLWWDVGTIERLNELEELLI